MIEALGLPIVLAVPRCDDFRGAHVPRCKSASTRTAIGRVPAAPVREAAGLSLRRGDIGRAAARTGLRTARAGPTVAHASCFQTFGGSSRGRVAALRWPGARDEPCSSSACSGDAP